MISHYIRRMARELTEYGKTYAVVQPGISEGAARSRLYNAARVAGVRISTRKVDHAIEAVVTRG